jgi:hypothetical protein
MSKSATDTDRGDRIRSFEYKGWDLFDAIDALKAFDDGVADSGVGDEDMRTAIVDHLHSLNPAERRKVCAEFARQLLTDEAIAEGYGLEDVLAFANWILGLGIPLA